MATDGIILLEYSQLSRSCGVEILSFTDTVRGFSSVSIDSRTVEEGALFAALSGSVQDGHSFVEAAFKNGADAALVDRRKFESYDLPRIAKSLGKTLIIANDTLHSLQDTARIYLKKFPQLLKIGITGSSGKTTTKEICAAIIGAEKNIIMNPGNYNSETGLPLSVFSVRACHEAGIFEMGMNRPGEIAELVSVLNPDIALITNVGAAHIGSIGSIEAIAKEKKNIFSRLDKKGIALIPEDSPYRDMLGRELSGRVAYYGEKSCVGFESARSLGLNGSEITYNGQKIHFALPGMHNLANALAAIAIANEVPVSTQAIVKGLESVRPLFGRGEILNGRVTVVQDCYNSNPESAAMALDFCDSLDWQGRRIYVIGEMLELGENSRPAHEELGLRLLASRADMVYLYGNGTGCAAEIMKNGTLPFMYTNDMDELSHALDSYVRSGDMVLLKGSRGCALERLSAVLLPQGVN